MLIFFLIHIWIFWILPHTFIPCIIRVFLGFYFFYDSWFTLVCQFLLYSKGTQSRIHRYILFLTLSSIIFHHKWLDIVPWAVQQDLIHSRYNSLHLLIPNSQSIPLLPVPLATKSVLQVHEFICFFFFFLRASSVAYGGSQARGQMRAVVAGLSHSHSNARSELCLWPAPQLTATADYQPTERGLGLNPPPHGYWSGSLPLSDTGTPVLSFFY